MKKLSCLVAVFCIHTVMVAELKQFHIYNARNENVTLNIGSRSHGATGLFCTVSIDAQNSFICTGQASFHDQFCIKTFDNAPEGVYEGPYTLCILEERYFKGSDFSSLNDLNCAVTKRRFNSVSPLMERPLQSNPLELVEAAD